MISTPELEWNVPNGYKTDGASVPAALWALYPPFTGSYRSAAVIHDYYCDNKERSMAGHAQGLLFRHACRQRRREDGQNHVHRRLSVRPALGPGTRPGQRNARVEATPERQEEVVKELQALVESENPDLDSLLTEAKRISAAAAGPSPKVE